MRPLAMVKGLLGLLGLLEGSAALQPWRSPQLLSCEHVEEMVAYAATLTANMDRADALDDSAQASSGLPTVCAKLDSVLFEWSAAMVDSYWPHDDPWMTYQTSHYACDPDGPSGVDKEACAPEGTMLCLYGIVSAMACVAVMYAWNAAEMQEVAGVSILAATNLEMLVQSRDKVLEFLDSSSWPFTLQDLVAVVDSYRPVLRSKRGQLFEVMVPEVDSRGPWSRGSEDRRRAEEAARRSLTQIATWTWPPAGSNEVAAAAGRPLPLRVRIWAFGTHCAVLAEPIASLALLFPQELQLEVAWRGTRDYCGYASGTWSGPTRDEDSLAGQVLKDHVRMFAKGSSGSNSDGRSWDADANRRTQLRARGDATSLSQPESFREALRSVLAPDAISFFKHVDPDFRAADLGLCSEPAYACLAMHDTGKPIIGYFGVHIGFMLRTSEEQLSFYRAFRDSLAASPRSTFATVAPYVSLQIFHHTSVQVPAIRPLSLYTQPATYAARASNEVLVNKRPLAFWDVTRLLDTFARFNSEVPLRFADAGALDKEGLTSYVSWASFRAAVYFPYDWLQTMTFYDWLAIGLPTFVQDTPMHTFATGTNPRREKEALAANLIYSHHWDATVWQAPAEVYPYHYGDWHDLPGRVYWWHLTDFHALPGVGRFTSVADLLTQLSSQEALWAASSRLRSSHLERTASAAVFWKGALARALAA